MNTFQVCYLFSLTALVGTSSGFGIRSYFHPSRSGENNFNFASTTDQVDLSIPYDAAAQLAYDAADSSDDFETFRARYNEESVKLVMSKRNLAESGADGEATKGEDTTAKKEETKPQNPVVAKLQTILRSKQKEYQNYLIDHSIEKKLKPIYERKGKIDTYTPRPIYDAETERLLMEVWEAKTEVRVMEAQSMDSGEADSLKEENESLQAGIKKLSEQFKAAQEESSRQLSEKEQEIGTLSTGLDSLASKLQSEQMESVRKTNDLKSLESKLEVLKGIETEASRLILELQERRKEIASRDAIIVSLQSKLDETEAALRVLQEERLSLRKLARQSWKTLSSRVKKRALRVKGLLLQKDHDKAEEVNNTNGEVNSEATKTVMALGKN